MTHPVQQNQNVSLNCSISTPEGKNQPLQNHFKDTLYLRQSSQFNFSLKSFFGTITDFFKTLFGCCFGSNSSENSTKNKIAEIARNKQFVWFYKKEENALTAFLGNFHPCKINLWGMQFKCAEAAYQAAKFAPNRHYMKQFENIDGEAAWQKGGQLSQQLSPQQVADFRQRNLDVMAEVIQAKFNQNPKLKELLLATGNAYLVEHTHRDGYWGDKGDGSGQNWLGRILMQERGEFGGTSVVPRTPQYDQFLRRQ
jgi:ribA/ribD-fused uncharacterized protein